MLLTRPGALEKTVLCPKCGTTTEMVVRNKVPVSKCKFGCGIWINQVDLDSQNASRASLPLVSMFWRSR